MNLSELSLKELKSLQNKVSKAILKSEKRKKSIAISELNRVAKASGYSLEDLLDDKKNHIKKSSVKKSYMKKSKVPAKYANPADPAQTWTGRGRKPAWVNDFLTSGKTLDDLMIK